MALQDSAQAVGGNLAGRISSVDGVDMSRAAMQMALEALVTCCAEEWRTLNDFGMKQVYDEKKVNAAIAALHAALAEPSPFENVLVYGSAWSKDGKRIDPMSIYKEPEQEPVAYCTLEQLAALKLTVPSSDKIALYTAPTPRKPLTEEEIVRLMVGEDRVQLLYAKPDDPYFSEFAQGAIRELVESGRAIERAHGIGEQHE